MLNLTISSQCQQALFIGLVAQSGATAYNDIYVNWPLSSHLLKSMVLEKPSQQKLNQVLSDREIQVLELVASGLTNEQISKNLEISKRTVDNHISNILTKTETENRVALVRWALQWGKVCLEDVNCCTLPSPDA